MKPELDVKLKKPNRVRGKGGKFVKLAKPKRRKPAPKINGYEPQEHATRNRPSRMTMSEDDKVSAQFWRKGKHG